MLFPNRRNDSRHAEPCAAAVRAARAGRIDVLAMTLEPINRADRAGAVCHASAHAHCVESGCSAVVSVIERNDAEPPLRFVLWCSLRGCAGCSEGCLRILRPLSAPA
jgi:hypothetical protein